MQKTRQSELERSRRASRLRLRFKHLHFQSSLRKNNSRRKAIRTGANDASCAPHFIFSLHASDHINANHSRGASGFGHWTTVILPSASRCNVGAYNPSNSRRHHKPCARFSAEVVNQYCQITARTWRGGSWGKGFAAKSERTSVLTVSSRSSVLGTIGLDRHSPSEANHKFQSNRG